MRPTSCLQTLVVYFFLPVLVPAQLVEISETVETRLVTLTELETFRETIFSQFRSLQSTIDTVTLITLTESSTMSVLTYSYEVGPSGIGWAIPSPVNGEPLPTQPSELPGSWTFPIPKTSSTATDTITGTATRSSPSVTDAITGSAAKTSPSATNTITGSTTSTSDSLTGTVTSFPTGFFPTELPGTTYTENGWITTTDSKHHTTLLPLITIGGGQGIVFWDLPPVPDVEFIFPEPFPKFPKLPSLPKFHLPCIKFFGMRVSGDCTEPPKTDGPSDTGSGSGPKSGDPPSKSQPPDGQSTGNEPSKSQPTKTGSPSTQTTIGHSTTSHSGTESTTSSSSTCRTYVTVSNCMETCVSTATSECASWSSTCSQTSSRCSAEGTTSTETDTVAACSATPTSAISGPSLPTSKSPNPKSTEAGTGTGTSTGTGTGTGTGIGTGIAKNTATPITFPTTRFPGLPTTFKTLTVSSKPYSTTSACVKTTLIDCIYNYETVPAGQPCPSSAAQPLPATCTSQLPFAGGSGIAPPPATTTSNSPLPTATWSSQYCYPRGVFGETRDINSRLQNQLTEQACAQADQLGQLTGEDFNWNATANNGGIYNFNIWWQSGCSVPTVFTLEAFKNMCLSSMRNDYMNCNNGGIGGYITYGCYNFEFKASLTLPGGTTFG